MPKQARGAQRGIRNTEGRRAGTAGGGREQGELRGVDEQAQLITSDGGGGEAYGKFTYKRRTRRGASDTR